MSKIKHSFRGAFYFSSVIIITVINLKSISEAIVVFGFGGIIYGFIEVLTRGYTHWSMVLTGGAVLSAIYILNLKLNSDSLILRCILGCLIITAAEFTVGCIVNLRFNMNVWDYSDEQYNVLGQICPLFSIAWFFLCIPAILISDILKKRLR